MSADAIEQRLRAFSRMFSRARSERVEMSPQAVNDRLRMQAGLTRMCLELVALGKRHRGD